MNQTMSLKLVIEKKKILGRHGCLNTFKKTQQQPPEMFYKKAVLLKT